MNGSARQWTGPSGCGTSFSSPTLVYSIQDELIEIKGFFCKAIISSKLNEMDIKIHLIHPMNGNIFSVIVVQQL